MSEVPYSGTIAYIGKPTVDGRTLSSLEVNALPLPVILRSTSNSGYWGSVRIGQIEAVRFMPDQSVQARLILDSQLVYQSLGLGPYPIGIDTILGKNANWYIEEHGDEITETADVVLIGATLVINGTPAWIDAEIEQGDW